MPRRSYRFASRIAVIGVSAITLMTALPAGCASAAGLFDFLFGGAPPPPPPPMRGFSPDELFRPPWAERRPRESIREPSRASGSYTAYCVRLCDGRYFPIQSHRNVSTAEMCHSFCPAAATQVFSGGGIENAVSHSGKPYTDLPNAFAYRKTLVANCTCNGKTPTGLAQVQAQEDPTLQPGDIVATESGLVAYSGRSHRHPEAFTPIDQVRMSRSLREHLAEIKVRRQLPAAARTTTGAAPEDSREVADEGDGSSPNIETLRGELEAVKR